MTLYKNSVKDLLAGLALNIIKAHHILMNDKGRLSIKTKVKQWTVSIEHKKVRFFKFLWRSRNSSKSSGQVSIFLVFIFQVVFVFFAMIVNVGLLVYYKINLQNSVDLASYYAAMKQAEMLNTIGHINYQIRQSWKLLVFRSTILGTLGTDSHPARPNPPGTDNFKAPPPEGPYLNSDGVPGFPVFCITIADIYANTIGTDASTIVNADDNQCRTDKDHPLNGFKIPDVIWALPGYNERIRDASIALQDKFLSEFSSGGIRNFTTQAAFLIQFRADSLSRRKLISVLANTMSRDLHDFFDVEGQSVSEGARKVLIKNSADQNNPTQFQLYNSLADINCGGPNSDIESLPGWLKEIEVLATFPYADSYIEDIEGSPEKKIAQNFRRIGDEAEISLPSEVNKPGLRGSDLYKTLSDINTLTISTGLEKHSAGRWTTAVGVEKNPWCMPYIGFKAESKPKLPFMPSSLTPTLVARSFAKPFGSKIGPWYGKTWTDKVANSSSDKNDNSRIDLRLPPRFFSGMKKLAPLSPKDYDRFFPNYSRFPGDKFGLWSQAVRWGYGRYFWKSNRQLKPPFWTSMWLGPFRESFEKNRQDNSNFFLGPLSGDILADAYNNNFYKNASDVASAKKYAREMRISELAAIAPDLYDISYYTIEPRFTQFLLPKLEEFVKKHNSKRPSLMVRGDLGWRSLTSGAPGEPGIADAKTSNIEMQVDQFQKHDFFNVSQNQIFQTISNSDHLLTAWSEKSIIDYSPSVSLGKIGKCFSRTPAGADPWTPGSCSMGGRVGYSVKVVSKKFLTGMIPNIGGDGISGIILNPPDPSF